MRGLVVLAVFTTVSAARADFGVNYDMAHDALTTRLSSPLKFEECEKGVCSYTHPSHTIEVGLVLSDRNVVEGFGITYGADSLTAASTFAREIQKALLIPEHDIVVVDDIARQGLEGVKGDAQTETAICFASRVEAEHYLFCRRK